MNGATTSDAGRRYGVTASEASAKRTAWLRENPQSKDLIRQAELAAERKAAGLQFIPPDLRDTPKAGQPATVETAEPVVTEEVQPGNGKRKRKGAQQSVAATRSAPTANVSAPVAVKPPVVDKLSAYMGHRERVQLKLANGTINMMVCRYVLEEHNLFLFVDTVKHPVPFTPTTGSELTLVLPAGEPIVVVYMGGYIELPELDGLAILHYYVRPSDD